MSSNGNGFDWEKIRSMQFSRRKLVQTAATATAVAGIPSVIRPGHTVAQNATVNVLAPAWPQVPTE